MRELNLEEVMNVQGAAGNKYWFSTMIDSALSYGFTMAAADVIINLAFVPAPITGSVAVARGVNWYLNHAVEGFVVGAVAGAAKEGLRKLNQQFDLY